MFSIQLFVVICFLFLLWNGQYKFESPSMWEDSAGSEAQPPVFDPVRCAQLHNDILRKGLSAVGHDDPTAIGVQSWWELNAPSEDIVDRLNPPIIEFLKRAQIVPPSHSHQFFYFLWGMTGSGELFDELLSYQEEDRYIFLYYYGMPVGHTYGLVLDQQDFTAVVAPSIWDLPEPFDRGYGWVPFESILAAYLTMIEEGKISLTSDERMETSVEKNMPWVFHPYSQLDLERAVTAFNRLLNAIDSRLPTESSTGNEYELPWADQAAIDEAGVGNDTFARKFFLATASTSSISPSVDNQTTTANPESRTVRFRYIAPGIRLQTRIEFIRQPFKYVNFEHDTQEDVRSPFLLFTADRQTAKLTPEDSAFGQRYDSAIPAVPSGLYLDYCESWSPDFAEDGVKLVLPFGVGANGWAVTSEGCRMGGIKLQVETDGTRGIDQSAMLYQTVYNPYISAHAPQMYKVLDNWAERVEKGDWEVGEDGVLGGIGKWKDADTEENWHKYYLPLSW